MRNLKFIVLFTIVIAFISCSSDDDNGNDQYTKENLLGKYQLKSFSSTEIKNVKVDEDITVTIETTAEGDTFNLSYDFANNNEVTLDGNFRIEQTKKQNSTTIDSSYIVNYNEEKLSYMVNEDQKLLTIDGKEYEVKSFNSNGFKAHHTSLSNDEEGNSREYEENLRFSK